MKENISNSDILDKIIAQAGISNDNQLATYLTERYGVRITRQQVLQFRNSSSMTITHLLLREAIKNA